LSRWIFTSCLNAVTTSPKWPQQTLGLYNPGIPAKFINEDGRKLWISTAGNPPDAKYDRLNMIPVELRLDV